MYNNKSFSKPVKIVCLMAAVLFTFGAVLFFLPIGNSTEADADEIGATFQSSGIYIPCSVFQSDSAVPNGVSWNQLGSSSCPGTMKIMPLFFVFGLDYYDNYVRFDLSADFSNLPYRATNIVPEFNYSTFFGTEVAYSANSSLGSAWSYSSNFNYTMRFVEPTSFYYVSVRQLFHTNLYTAFVVHQSPYFSIKDIYAYSLEKLDNPLVDLDNNFDGAFGVASSVSFTYSSAFYTKLTLMSHSTSIGDTIGTLEFYFPCSKGFYGFSNRTYYLNTDLSYEEGYNDGFSVGNQEGINQGSSEGYQTGYTEGQKVGEQNGYNRGFSAGVVSSNDYSFISLISAVIDAPIQAFNGMLDFDVFGYNMKSFYLSLITVSLIIFIVKLLI